MNRIVLLVSLLLPAMNLAAQELPAGTALPVMLNSAIDAGSAVSGRTIRARLMQDVNLSSGVRIRAGATVLGSIVAVSQDVGANGSKVAIRFDRLVTGRRELHFTSHLRAVASMTEVFEAQLPMNAIDDYGTSIADWNTVQVGGNEVVYRGNGTVMSASNIIGSASISGAVQAQLQPVRSGGCHGGVNPQALWVFSTTACGVYGYDDITIAHWGRTNPAGDIVLVSKGRLRVQSGSGLLLIAN